MSGQSLKSQSIVQSPTPELHHKARLLINSPLFDGTPLGHPVLEKQLIFLVLAGLKPVAEVTSGHWVEVERGRKTVADDASEVSTFLKLLGLSHSLSSFDGHATDAIVALRPHLIEEYRQAKGAMAVGRLFGYPETAVQAFEAGGEALLSLAEQEQLEREAGLPDGFTHFCLSREHAVEELAVVKGWYTVLQAVELVE